jgi:Arc/MetJ family transcription regulator
MPTNLALDDELIDEALRLGGHRTKRQAVYEALEEYVARRKRREIASLFGRTEWDSEYDYKNERQKR